MLARSPCLLQQQMTRRWCRYFRALPLFIVALHHVRCQKLLSCGARAILFCGLFGRRAGSGPGWFYVLNCYTVIITTMFGEAGRWYLTYPGDKPDLFYVVIFYHRGRFPVVGWSLREVGIFVKISKIRLVVLYMCGMWHDSHLIACCL